MSETYVANMPQYAHLTQLHDDRQTLFMEKVGCLIHLAMQSRPDLIFSVTQLSRRNKKATRSDMSAVDRVLRYVAGSLLTPMAYLLNCMPLLMFPTIAIQTRSRTQVSQYTTVASQLHV